MSTLGSQTVFAANVALTTFGEAVADVVLAGGDLPSVGDSLTLTLTDLVLTMTVLRAGFDQPDRPHVVLESGAGWSKLVSKPLSFQSDSGVRLSTILSALASAAGETIEQPADATVGTHWELEAARTGEPVHYRDALQALVRSGNLAGWRVDPDGTTRFGARVGTAVTVRATRLTGDAASGATTYGIDSAAAFLPGNTVNGATIARSVIRETSGKLEVDVYAAEPAAAPTPRASLQRMLLELLGDVVRTYTIDSVHSDGRLALVAPPDAPHLPELDNVEQWTLGGGTVTAVKGMQVLVTYADLKNKTRPIAFAFGPGTPDKVVIDAATEIDLGKNAAQGVARDGDTVTVMLPPAVFSGTISGAPAVGMLIFSTGQTIGTITTASAKVKAE